MFIKRTTISNLLDFLTWNKPQTPFAKAPIIPIFKCCLDNKLRICTQVVDFLTVRGFDMQRQVKRLNSNKSAYDGRKSYQNYE